MWAKLTLYRLNYPRAEGMAAEALRTPEPRSASSDLVEGDHLHYKVDMGEVRIPVADDHRMQAHVVELKRQGEGERVMVAEAVHGPDPEGNLEGELFVVQLPMVLDTIHNDLECEWAVILIHRYLDNQAEAEVVAEEKPRNFDVVLETGAYVEGFSDRI